MYQVALGFLQISHPSNFSILENVNLSSQPKSFNRSKHIFRKFHFLKIKAASTASHFWALPDWRPAALLMETSLKTEEDGEGMARSRGCTLAGTRWRHGGKRDIATQTSLSVPQPLAQTGVNGRENIGSRLVSSNSGSRYRYCVNSS